MNEGNKSNSKSNKKTKKSNVIDKVTVTDDDTDENNQIDTEELERQELDRLEQEKQELERKEKERQELERQELERQEKIKRQSYIETLINIIKKISQYEKNVKDLYENINNNINDYTELKTEYIMLDGNNYDKLINFINSVRITNESKNMILILIKKNI
jgi:hypothetical protein